jgi:hypothetical protein
MTIDITKVPDGYTEEEWSDLSDVEKEGICESIEAPEGEEEPQGDLSEEQLKKIVEEDKPPKKKPDEQDANPANGDGGDTPPEKPPEKPPENPEEPQAVTDEALLSFKAVVTDDELKLEEVIPPELKQQMDELEAKYDEGDMSIHDYTAARDKVNRQIYKHNAGLEADARSEIAWKKEQFHFLKNRPEYLPGQQADAPGKVRANALFGALSETIKGLSSEEANANLTGMQLLVKADAIVKEAFGLKPGKKPEEKKPDEKKPAAALPDHKTLSDVPAAGKNGAEDDAFAQLDKLSGEAYEAALERLSPEVRDAYLSRA